MTDYRFAPLAEQDSAPLYRQLYERVRGAIAAGSLGPGDRLPSARALAKELGVARGTIELAYSLLTSEGYLLARGQAGTVVNPHLQAQAAPMKPAPSPAPAAEDAPDSLWRPGQLLPFQMGVPALDAFPRKIWARLGARYLRGMQADDLDYPPAHGLPALRSAIASYLQVSRGIDCGAHQVFVTSGWPASLAFVAHAVLGAGQRAWVEDPGYPPARQILRQFGLEPVPVEVDEQGLKVEQGIALAADARVAVVTPAHQSPLSMTLSLPRRQALLDWASSSGAWVVEDDYDGEYRYSSRPLPALASLDRHGRVFYAGTFSKVLFPGIRLAYLVVPQAQVARFEQIGRALFAAATPRMTQALVADFIAEGHFTRHIQRMRRLYGERRTETIAALERGLAGCLKVEQSPGGMNLVLRLPGDASDRPLADHLLAHGMAVQALSRWWASSRRDSALLLSFTNCTSPEQAQHLGELIRQAL
ncbi:MocR-like pyridoxine biosynthesis transcription factor PdxR [Pseudomonas sp. Gutcm_11s]|uniref:MocR-like pyridoxine biosynthesis transcription factor PdxR n=1 Tax=Pseudomonas sp. Gutcm_11s TaxID=3026088 RepID=UPI00236307A7|nr:PLP-dependent aminotransferase family protein [Pseudomonas sp. Gutcm_11s]MDD0841267.1 PLP-dependent aminotransferase family protein [Pseudomonas sp. Gutcm_11s]